MSYAKQPNGENSTCELVKVDVGSFLMQDHKITPYRYLFLQFDHPFTFLSGHAFLCIKKIVYSYYQISVTVVEAG